LGGGGVKEEENTYKAEKKESDLKVYKFLDKDH
jgi:hypothetical protein